VRCLMSAPSAGQAFDLRCEVREKLIDFLNKEHPEALPVQRQVRLDERSEDRPEQRLREEAPNTAPADPN
jgi:hypothetical protein